MTTTEVPGGVAVVDRVLRAANEVLGLVAVSGRNELRGPIAELSRRWRDTETTVVVAGAQKRGKSSLLNVLLGHPGLLPVASDIASDTHVSIGHGATLTAFVHRVGTDGRTSSVQIDPAEISQYAAVTGDPALRRGVVGVDVTIESTLLDHVCLVDTPGVDSLTLGHRHATMAALGRADALLFAVSAQDQPILRHELEFLAQAAARVGSVTFVLTKADDTAVAGEMLEENRDRLARFVQPRPDGSSVPEEVARRLLAAPWILVSARLGARAAHLRAEGRADEADRRRARSGLDALERAIRNMAADRDLIRASGVIAVATLTLDGLEAVLRDDQIGSSDDAAALAGRKAELDGERALLAARERQRKQDAVDLQLLLRDATQRARARMADYQRTYEREIAGLQTPTAISTYAERLPESLEQTFTAAWSEVTTETEEFAGAAIAGYLGRLGLEPTDLDATKLAMPPLARRDIVAEQPRQAFDLVGEGVPVVTTTASLGLMGSHLIPALAITGPFAVVPFAIGAAIAIAVVGHRRKQVVAARSRTALLAAVTDAFTNAANKICLEVERAVMTWRTVAEQTVTDVVAAQQRELAERQRALVGLSERDAAERARAAATAAERLRRVADLRTRVDGLRTDLDAAVRASRNATVSRRS